MAADITSAVEQSTEATVSWADLARASSQIESSAKDALSSNNSASPVKNSFPGGDQIRPGDQIDHLKFGRCTILEILGDFVHMAPVNARVIRLSKSIVTFTPVGIENNKRVFSASTK